MRCGAAEPPAVRLDQVTKRFRGTVAVENISLEVPRGEVFGLIGPNGAGKSTTIKILMGMLSRDTGTVELLGLDVLREPSRVRQRVGYVPEVNRMYGWMTVGEVINFASSLYETWNHGVCAEMLDLFELDQRKKVRHLSKGMAAKLSLLVAVAHEPELLILDEPMSGMDPIVREEFLDGVLQSICRSQRTILFSSHTLDDVQRLADTVGIMAGGRLLVHQRLDELLASTRRVRAVLEEGRLPCRAPDGTVWQRVDRREWLLTVRGFTDETLSELTGRNPVSHVEVLHLGLEDLFKDLIRGQRAPA